MGRKIENIPPQDVPKLLNLPVYYNLRKVGYVREVIHNKGANKADLEIEIDKEEEDLIKKLQIFEVDLHYSEDRTALRLLVTFEKRIQP